MFSLARAHLAFDDDGQFADEELRRRFQMTIASFMDLVEASKHYPCVKKYRREKGMLGETASATTASRWLRCDRDGLARLPVRKAFVADLDRGVGQRFGRTS